MSVCVCCVFVTLANRREGFVLSADLKKKKKDFMFIIKNVALKIHAT